MKTTRKKTMICSKADFDKYLEKYLEVQQAGLINMLDVANGTMLSGLSEEKYRDIIKNYKHYKHKYYGNK